MNYINGNYVDLIIIAILIYFLFKAFNSGFIKLVGDAFSFLISLFISIKVYVYVAKFFEVNFSLNKLVSESLGFLFTSILIEMFIGSLIYYLIAKLPKKILQNKYDKVLGIIPALIEGSVFVVFILILIINFPVRPNIKKDILDSRIGGFIVNKTGFLAKNLSGTIDGILNEALPYLAVEPDSKGSIDIKSKVDKLTTDTVSETEMFKLVNEERAKAGVSQLTWEPKIVPVAESYATDMWKRSYFSHYSPEGEDVGDRLNEAKIKYHLAGENLALAPSLAIAHKGLMDSKGHRENILSPDFKKVGIGVIDNGVYGKIFVQVFTGE